MNARQVLRLQMRLERRLELITCLQDTVAQKSVKGDSAKSGSRFNRLNTKYSRGNADSTLGIRRARTGNGEIFRPRFV